MSGTRPVEPTGLGAVVEDEYGVRWKRGWTADGQRPWYGTANGPGRDYIDIAVIRVLSEGVTP